MHRETKATRRLDGENAEEAGELLDIFSFREKPFRGVSLHGSDSEIKPPASTGLQRPESPGTILDPSFFPSGKKGRDRKRQKSGRSGVDKEVGSSLPDPFDSSVVVNQKATRAEQTSHSSSSSSSSAAAASSSTRAMRSSPAPAPLLLLDLASSDDSETESRDSEAVPFQHFDKAGRPVESPSRDLIRPSSTSSSTSKAVVELLHLLHQSKSRLQASATQVPVSRPADGEEMLEIPKVLTAAERAEALTKRRGHNDLYSSKDSEISLSNDARASGHQEGTQMLRLKSRLNGKHDWKWKVSLDDKFLKIKAKFAEVYGLPHPGSISFRFDGELIEDDACPGEIGLEDEDLIDAQVDKTLFEAAVASANARKNNS